MKIVSKAFLAGGLLMLSACGGAEEENLAANSADDALYNVSEDLSLDNSLGNDLGNASLGNEADALNLSDSSNLSDSNLAGNSQ